MEEVEKLASALGEKLYKDAASSAQAAGEGADSSAGGGDADGQDEDIIDADFEVKDESVEADSAVGEETGKEEVKD